MKTVGLPVLSTILAFAAVASAHGQARELPDGRFTLFAGNDDGANFIVEGSQSRSGEKVRVTNYRVYANEIPSPGGPIDQDLTELEIDCAARSQRILGVHAFGPTGRWVVSLPAEDERPIEPRQTWDFVARIVCDGTRMPAEATIEGREAARGAARARLG